MWCCMTKNCECSTDKDERCESEREYQIQIEQKEDMNYTKQYTVEKNIRKIERCQINENNSNNNFIYGKSFPE